MKNTYKVLNGVSVYSETTSDNENNVAITYFYLDETDNSVYFKVTHMSTSEAANTDLSEYVDAELLAEIALS